MRERAEFLPLPSASGHREIQVVTLCPLFRRNLLLRLTMEFSKRAIEQRQNAVGITGDDARLQVIKHGLQELLLALRCRPLVADS